MKVNYIFNYVYYNINFEIIDGCIRKLTLTRQIQYLNIIVFIVRLYPLSQLYTDRNERTSEGAEEVCGKL